MECIGYSGNLFDFRNTPGIHEIGLGNIHSVQIQELAKLALVVEPLAAHNRYRYGVTHFGVGSQIVGRDRIFKRKEVIRLKGASQTYAGGYRKAAVAVDQQLDVGPYGFAHGGKHLGCCTRVSVVFVRVKAEAAARQRAALESAVPLVD